MMATVEHLTDVQRRMLEDALKEYSEGNRDALKEENDMLVQLPLKFQEARRIEDKEDFRYIVQWKAARAWGYAKHNPQARIRSESEAAFRLADSGKLEDAIRRLRNPALKGVETRMATAILMFYRPERFTVLDYRAWRSLVHLRVLDPFDCWFEEPEDYPPYLEACKLLADWFGRTLRETDRALWQLKPLSPAQGNAPKTLGAELGL